jgi:thymidylate synthase
MVVGFPLDIARYTIILTMMAKLTGFTPRYVYMPSSNSHIYQNCYGIVEELIGRAPRPDPILKVSNREFSSWDDIQLDDFTLEGYDPHPAIKVGVN